MTEQQVKSAILDSTNIRYDGQVYCRDFVAGKHSFKDTILLRLGEGPSRYAFTIDEIANESEMIADDALMVRGKTFQFIFAKYTALDIVAYMRAQNES